MGLFETILLNVIFIIFPLIFCLLYQTYNKTLNKEKNDLFLDFALFSSFYLIIRFGTVIYMGSPLLLFNIPLILAYIKDRKAIAVILSISSIVYYFIYMDISLLALVVEYCIYYGIYLLYKTYQPSKQSFINVLIALKCSILTVYSIHIHYYIADNFTNFISFLITCISFFTITKFTLYLFERAEEVLALHTKIIEFEQEKQIRESLFKITHEIKNPIAVCKGYLDMFDANNPNHSQRYIPIIKEEIERVLILLQDFLSINKIKIEKDIMDVNYLLENIQNNFIPMLESQNIEADFKITDDELFILGDYNRLAQVLINVIKNSIESIPEDKEGKIEVSVLEQKTQVKIIISDNGVGMNKDELLKLKEPFFTTKKKGTGLGVYLSDEIIRSHNGTIGYTSKLEAGTKVIITLPKELKKAFA